MKIKVQELLRDVDTGQPEWTDFYSVACGCNTDVFTEVEFFLDLTERTQAPLRLEVSA